MFSDLLNNNHLLQFLIIWWLQCLTKPQFFIAMTAVSFFASRFHSSSINLQLKRPTKFQHAFVKDSCALPRFPSFCCYWANLLGSFLLVECRIFGPLNQFVQSIFRLISCWFGWRKDFFGLLYIIWVIFMIRVLKAFWVSSFVSILNGF